MPLTTLGLTGRRGASLTDLLIAEEPDVFVDMRLLPEDANEGLSAPNIRRLVEATGVVYLHRPGLAHVRRGRALKLRDPRELAALGRALEAGKRVVLACSEESPTACTRRRYAEELGAEARHL